jgi:predicted permease
MPAICLAVASSSAYQGPSLTSDLFMLIIFESILPIFLVIVTGVVLKRLSFFEAGLWEALEQLSFYLLFPTYLFLTLAQADYADIEIGPVSLVYIGAILLVAGLMLAAWPMLRRLGVNDAQFSTLFQTSTRWNGFVALAIAERIADRPGLSMIAFIIGAIIIPVNFMNIGLLIWIGGGKRDLLTILVKMVTNPLVFSSLLGILYHAMGLTIYAPVASALDLVSRCALGMGLILLGAGLQVGDALRLRPLTVAPVLFKLLVFPAIVVGLATLAGMDRQTLLLLALAASVPTAMNGYLLAKKMGGDAPLYASISTLQTVAAFLTMPLVLAVVGMF